MADQVYLCPKCKSEDIRKASLVYETEVKNTNTQTLGGGIAVGGSGIQGIGGGIASSKGTIKSLLSERIAPPQKQNKDIWIFCSVIMFVSAYIIYCSMPTVLVLTLIIFTFAIVMVPLALYQKKINREYEEDLRSWNFNWVCNRCGNVFAIEDGGGVIGAITGVVGGATILNKKDKIVKSKIPLIFISVIATVLAIYAVVVWLPSIPFRGRQTISLEKEKQVYNKGVKKILRKKPKSAEDYKMLGKYSFTQNNFDQAIAEYTKAIEANPNDYTFYMERGMSFLQKKDLDHAIGDFSKVIEIKPDLADAYFFRGGAYFSEKEYNKGWEDLSKAKFLGYNAASELLGKMEKILTNINLEGLFVDASGKNSAIINGKVIFEGDSIGDIKLEKINKDSVDIVWLAVGQKRNIKVGQNEGTSTRITGEGQNQAASEGNLGKMISSSNDSAESFKDQGDTYLSQGNFIQAITAFSRAIESSPNDGEAYAGRAMVYFENREYNNARKDAYKAKELGYELTPLFFENLDRETGQ